MTRPVVSSSVPWDHTCLDAKQKAVQFWGRALGSEERGPGGVEAIPRCCVCHLSIGACSHRVTFPKGASVWTRCLGTFGQQGTAGNWKVSALFPKNTPTYPSCLQYPCKAAYSGHTYPWLLCASRRSSACSSAAVLPRLTPLSFTHSPCSECSYPSFFPKLPANSSSSAHRQLILVAAAKGKGSLTGTETLRGFRSR